MPHRVAAISRDVAVEHAARRGFCPPRPGGPEKVGIELEMLPFALDGTRPDHDVVVAAMDTVQPLRTGTSITFEPGGQLELSTTPAADIDTACDGLEADLAAVSWPLAEAGIVLVGAGVDPVPGVGRVIRSPRYDAMDAYFTGPDSRWGRAGRTMMCASAGLQVNLDFDARTPSPDTRWGLAHVVGPTLTAAFANSPLFGGVPTGWKSYRMANWWRLDPSRTRPAGGGGPGPDTWAAYVMDAQVMLIRTGERCIPVRTPLTFGEWVERGHPLGFPTLDDLDYHITTLFPPVRPRGWLELRTIDCLPRPWWRVPVAVATALAYDAEAGEAAAQAAWNTADLWVESFRSGMAHPDLAAAAQACFAVAQDALRRMDVGTPTLDVVGEYAERFVNRHRCPADDVLDHWRRTGQPFLPGDRSWAVVPAASVRP